MNKLFAIISLIVISTISVSAQEYLIEELVAVDSLKGSKGPNLRNYHHFFISYGNHFSDNTLLNKDLIGNSHYFEFGYRYKYRPINLIHVGTDISYTRNKFKLFTAAPITAMNDTYKRHMRVHSLRMAPYLRFNCYNRGNRIAFYLDLSAYGNFNFWATSVEHYEEVYSFEKQTEKVKRKTRGKDFVENFDYGLGVRLGYHRFALFLNYSLLEVKNRRANETIEFYPISAGLQIGLF